jgi:hypothetical protein
MPSKTTPPTSPSTARRPRTKISASAAVRPRKTVKTPEAVEPDDAGTAEPDPALEQSAGPALLEGPTREQMIRARAYEHYERNGCVDGREVDDWLAAEAEVGALMTEGSTRATG